LDSAVRRPLASPACSATSMSVQVNAAEQASPHNILVDVFSPQPGGGPETGPTLKLIIARAADPDFAVTSDVPTKTVNPGSLATYAISVAAQNGFASSVALTCVVTTQVNVQPQFKPTCAANPASVTAGTPVVLTVTTFARALVPPPSATGRIWRWDPGVAFPLVASFLMAWIYCARTRRMRAFGGAAIALLILMVLFQAAGCGGASGPPLPQPIPSGTTAGPYTVTLTGTSGSLRHDLPLILNVN
jgi:hypothetical protein